MMAKSKEKNPIDKDLEDLYKSAKGSKTECPHCKEMIEFGGDFTEKARAMELRIKYEAIKSKNGPAIVSFFEDEKDE
jgi:hypothetical protein